MNEYKLKEKLKEKKEIKRKIMADIQRAIDCFEGREYSMGVLILKEILDDKRYQ